VIVSGVLAGPGETFAGGPEAVRAALDRARERWGAFTLRERSYEPGGSRDLVLVRSVLSARAHGTPLESEWTSWGVFSIHEGMIHSFRLYHTEEEGRLAAGLSPANDRRPSPPVGSDGSRHTAKASSRRLGLRLGGTRPPSARRAKSEPDLDPNSHDRADPQLYR
jgi:hypothetical protein